ncbi:MAG TPA: tetratricopeptide repeat protein [bacterium]|nr:tetratricopeptide repeat protein [bacterium]
MRFRILRAAAGILAVGLTAGATPAGADLAQAELAWQRGERREAARLVREYVADHPEGARSARVAALLARTAEKPAEALGRWDEVIALEPDGELAAEAHFAKGLHAYSAGLYVGAKREFEILVERFPREFDRGRALLWKGNAELGANEPTAAFETLESARGAARDPADVRSAELGIAHAAYQQGNAKEALRRYERFERDHPEDGRASSAARRAVECLRLLGRTGEATVMATRIEREYPDSFEATLARAEVRESSAAAPPAGDDVQPAERAEAPGRTGPFVVQVASMGELRNAVALRRDIRGLGIDGVRIELYEGREGSVHRVLLGPYETEEQAQVIADSVAALGDLNPRVRPEEKK